MTRAEIGRWGEDTAARYLESKGYTILARNHHSKYGEVDIIAKDDKYIVFAEVKVRAQGARVTGLEAVTYSKASKILKTAVLWMNDNPTKLQPRFDIIEITTLSPGTTIFLSLKVTENAFGAEVCREYF
ncbi:MAG: YraN family protein [Clostridia bacterium]|nr:YraN family protein [Clostridia bacterium]